MSWKNLFVKPEFRTSAQADDKVEDVDLAAMEKELAALNAKQPISTPTARMTIPKSGPSTLTSPMPSSSPKLGFGASFADIYATANVPVAPKSAEEILSLIDNMNALPEPQRKIAIFAMDKADGSWSAQEVLSDAAAKVNALVAFVEKMNLHVTTATQEATANKQQLAIEKQQFQDTILAQIAKLNSDLANGLEMIGKKEVDMDQRIVQLQENARTEQERVRIEAQRLSSLNKFFTE